MTFMDLSFWIFLPAAALLYYAVPARWQNAALLLASWAFYAFTTPAWLPLLIAASAAVWAVGLRLGKSSGAARNGWMAAGAAATLGALVLLRFASAAVQRFTLALPLGLSFFTLQALGYLIDVYRGKYAAERSFVRAALFVGYFGCVLSGPIERGDNLLPQLEAPRRFDANRAAHSLVTIAFGYLYKVAAADLLAIYANAVFGDVRSYTGLALTAGALAYGFQLYFDFAGYSLMALGVSELLGIRVNKNFDTPYFARSIKEFWGRWHMSLSSWLRDYVYIPLGGNRKGRARKCVNLLATFAVSGLWHGTGLTYFVWGLLHGAYQCAETLLPRRKGPGKHRAADALGWAATFLLVQLAWVFFRAQSVSDALYLLAAQFQNASLAGLFDAVFAAYNESFQTALLVYAALAFTLAACAACILCDFWRRFKAPGGDLAGAAMALPRARRWILYYLLAGMVFAGYLLNNGYFATAANTLYQNF